MAVSKLTEWFWVHKLGSHMALMPNYAVYADMSNGNTQPYLTLSNWRVHSLRNKTSWISPHLPLTIRIQVNGTGTVYSFSSGSTVKHEEEDIIILDDDTPDGDSDSISGDLIGYYYVNFSSSTHIPIPKDGQTFTLNITVTTKDGSSYTFTEYEAAPISTSISGAGSINTGVVSPFTLSRAMVSDGTYATQATLAYYFTSWGSSSTVIEGYTSPYMLVSGTSTPFTEIRFVPLAGGAAAGTRSTAQTSDQNKISLTCTYKLPVEAEIFSDVYHYFGYGGHSRNVMVFWSQPSTHMITSVTKSVVVVAQSGVDESLRPEFKSVSYSSYYQNMVAHYGAAIQGHVKYGITVSYVVRPSNLNSDRHQYGSQFRERYISDYTSGSLVSTSYIGYASSQSYSVELNNVVNNARVDLSAVDAYGFTTSYTDYVSVIGYEDPRMPLYRARRCSPVSGTPAGSYVYDDTAYVIDDYGEYVLIEWSVRFASLNNINTKSLVITAPDISSQSGYSDLDIELPGYVCDGFFVLPTDPEKSYIVKFTLMDDFHNTRFGNWVEYGMTYNQFTGERAPYGYASAPVVYSYPVNSILAMIDFRREGNGVALGKVSEYEDTFDIHRNWLLKMPYDTMVQNYNSDGSAIRLYDWLNRTMSRIQAIIDSRDWYIYGYKRGEGQVWRDGYTRVAIPSGNGSIYEGGNYRCLALIPNVGKTVGITTVEGITINRNYLNFRFDPSESWRGQDWNSATYTSTIYLCSTRPTSVDQTTGRPNATIVNYQTLTTAYYRVGSFDDGYSVWDCSSGTSLSPGGAVEFNNGTLHSFNVASYKGQKLWFVITCTQGGNSPSGYYQYRRGQINLYDVVLSNKSLFT